MRQRIVTAALLLVLVTLLALRAPSPAFIAILAVVLFLAAREWWLLARVSSPWPPALLAATFSGIGAIPDRLAPPILALGASLFWTLIPLLLARAVRPGPGLRPLSAVFSRFLSIPVLLPPFLLAAWVQGFHGGLLLWGILLISASDVGAMFAGRRFGRRRLAPLLSPGKTVEGLWGGLIAGALVGTLGAGLLYGMHAGVLAMGAATGAVVSGYGVLGDLLESLLKRSCGKKDSGTLLPGHGGILDRIDAMTSGLPVFFLFSYFQGWWT